MAFRSMGSEEDIFTCYVHRGNSTWPEQLMFWGAAIGEVRNGYEGWSKLMRVVQRFFSKECRRFDHAFVEHVDLSTGSIADPGKVSLCSNRQRIFPLEEHEFTLVEEVLSDLWQHIVKLGHGDRRLVKELGHIRPSAAHILKFSEITDLPRRYHAPSASAIILVPLANNSDDSDEICPPAVFITAVPTPQEIFTFANRKFVPSTALDADNEKTFRITPGQLLVVKEQIFSPVVAPCEFTEPVVILAVCLGGAKANTSPVLEEVSTALELLQKHYTLESMGIEQQLSLENVQLLESLEPQLKRNEFRSNIYIDPKRRRPFRSENSLNSR